MTGPVRDPQQLDQDSRGIVSPARFARAASLLKFPVDGPLTGLVRQFWVLRWSLPDGAEHTQSVLSHPGANISVGSTEADPDAIEAKLYGVTRELFVRTLRRTGWTVAATTWPGGLGAFLTGPAQDCTDRVLRLEDTLGLDGDALIASIRAEDGDPGPDAVGPDAVGPDDAVPDDAVPDDAVPDDEAQVAVLADALTGVLDRAPEERVDAAHEIAAVARAAEVDRRLRRVEQLAAEAGLGVRTLQRMFREYAGVSPAWMLRRYRLLDAAERVCRGETVNWADVAGELGFSDQAHLVREFRAAIGETPEAYARLQRSGPA